MESLGPLPTRTEKASLGFIKTAGTYSGSSPVYSEWNALLPSVGDWGFLYKNNNTDPVFLAFRRSTSVGDLTDFGIIELS